MATSDTIEQLTDEDQAGGKTLADLAPPAPAEPESIADAVRRQWAVIMATWIEGYPLAVIGQSLEPKLEGSAIQMAIYNDAELLKRWEACKEHRAHQLVDRAGSMAAMLVGKDGVDSQLKVASILAPKLYGPKATLELTGKDGGPLKAVVEMDPIDAYKAMLGG